MRHQLADSNLDGETNLDYSNKDFGPIILDSFNTIKKQHGPGFYSKLGRDDVKHVMDADIPDIDEQSETLI